MPRRPIKPTGFFVANSDGDKTDEMIDHEKNKALILEVLNDPKVELHKFYNGLGLIQITRNRTLKEPEGEFSRKVQYVMRRIEEVQPHLIEDSKALFEKIETSERERLRLFGQRK